MSTEKNDPRTLDALNGHKTTSLVDFISNMDKGDSTDEQSISDDNNGGTDANPSVSELFKEEESVEETSQDSTSEGESKDKQEDEQEFEVKDKKVKLKDLLNSYETREEISRRFNEVGIKEKKIKEREEIAKKQFEELRFINEKFDEMREQIVVHKNPLAALQIAATMQLDGKEPSAENNLMMKELIDQANQMSENWHNMSEDEREVFLKKQAIEDRERKLSRIEKKKEAEQKELEIKGYFDNVLDQFKLTDAEMDAAYDDIVQLPKFKEQLDAKDEKGKIKYCAEWVLGKRIRNTVTEGIAKAKPGSEKDNDFVLAVLDVVDANCTVDTVAQIVRDALKLSGQNSAKEAEASKKDVVAKTTTPNRVPTEKPKAGKEDTPVLSYKDLIAKYS